MAKSLMSVGPADVNTHQRRAAEAFATLQRMRSAAPRDRSSPSYAQALADAEAAYAAADAAHTSARRGYLAGPR